MWAAAAGAPASSPHHPSVLAQRRFPRRPEPDESLPESGLLLPRVHKSLTPPGGRRVRVGHLEAPRLPRGRTAGKILQRTPRIPPLVQPQGPEVGLAWVGVEGSEDPSQRPLTMLQDEPGTPRDRHWCVSVSSVVAGQWAGIAVHPWVMTSGRGISYHVGLGELPLATASTQASFCSLVPEKDQGPRA